MYPPDVQRSDAALHADHIGLSLSPTNAHRLATVKMSKRPAQFGKSSASSSKKSIVWTLFDDNCIDASKVTCRLCNAAFACGGVKKEGIGTSNLWAHRAQMQERCSTTETGEQQQVYFCSCRQSAVNRRVAAEITDRRNRLAPKKADMLLFIKHNLALIDFKYYSVSALVEHCV